MKNKIVSIKIIINKQIDVAMKISKASSNFLKKKYKKKKKT